LEVAAARLKAVGANFSIDVFGLTPSVYTDMGIGQRIMRMAQWVDFVSPMVYPSHYAKWEYGIPNPNVEPYKTVHKTMTDAKKRFGEHSSRLRPWLQDFSLGHKYGAQEVRAQIMACDDVGIKGWILWNPNCIYTRLALKSKDGILDKAAVPPPSMLVQLDEKEWQKKIDSMKAAKHLKTSTQTALPADVIATESSATAVSPVETSTPAAVGEKPEEQKPEKQDHE
jgi:putative glycosyl hydrolase protein